MYTFVDIPPYFGLQPIERLFLATLGLLFFIKFLALIIVERPQLNSTNLKRILLYMSIWPGMDFETLRQREIQNPECGRHFVEGWLAVLTGTLLFLFIGLIAPHLSTEILGVLGLLPLFLVLHFGVAKLITSLMWLFGWSVKPLFDKPLHAESLQDFWSHRWNLAFVEMNRLLFVKFCKQLFGRRGSVLAIFVLSGLFHEIGISFPAGDGWGLPTLYFTLHGLLFLAEQTFELQQKIKSHLLRRFLTLGLVIAPLPILFHAPFRETFIVPLYLWLNQILMSYTFEQYFDIALWLVVAGQMLIPVAGLQVPFRLNWKEDLEKLIPFNRKIMWNYYFFIFGVIVAFILLTGFYHESFLHGEPLALGLSLFIGTFWLIRILVDIFFFEHKDWPQGAQFVIGHTLLTSLFVLLSSVYLGLVVWHI